MSGKFLRMFLVLALLFSLDPASFAKTSTDEPLLLETQKLYLQAKDFYLKGELEAARKELLQILKLDSNDEIAREFLKAVSAELKGKKQKDKLFSRHYNLGRKYYRRKEWDKAKEELRKAVETYPQHKTASEVIQLWEGINQQIIRQAKEKVEKELQVKDKAIRRQEEKIAELKIKKKIAEEKKREIKRKPSQPLKKSEKPAREKPVVNLQGCIQMAILNSLPVKIAKKEVELAEMKLFEAWRVLFPSVIGEMRDTYGKTVDNDYESRSRSLQFQQLIFDGGRNVFLLHRAELGQKIARQNFDTVKQELIYQVEQNYYKLIYLQKVVKLQQSLYKQAQDFLDLTDKQYKLGYVSRLEFLNLESKFNQVGFSLISSQQALSLAKLKFQQVLNLDVPFALLIDEELSYNSDLGVNLDRCLNLALRNRPEIRVGQLTLASSKYGEKIAKRKGWPELSLVGSVGESGEAYTQDILRMREEWSVLGKLSWSFGGSSLDYSYNREKVNPAEITETNLTTEARTHSFKFGLLDNLDYYSKSKEAEIAFQKAMNDYNQLRQKITLEVKEAYFLYERAKIMLAAVESKIKYYKKEVEIAELRKSLDIVPLSTLLEAKINLSEQENAYSKALMEYYLALATLNRAMGISFYYSYGKR